MGAEWCGMVRNGAEWGIPPISLLGASGHQESPKNDHVSTFALFWSKFRGIRHVWGPFGTVPHRSAPIRHRSAPPFRTVPNSAERCRMGAERCGLVGVEMSRKECRCVSVDDLLRAVFSLKNI
eukprot:gene22373-biopygen7962